MKKVFIFLINFSLFLLTFLAGYLYLETGKAIYIGAAVANFLALKLGLMIIGAFYSKKSTAEKADITQVEEQVQVN